MDDIQRKLALIDAQLTGRADLHRRIISTAPLLFAAVGLIIGILIQSALSGPPDTGHGARLLWPWLILLAASAASAVLLFALQMRGKFGSYALVFLSTCALICFASLGAVRLIAFKPTIRGLVITEPYINYHRQWEFARFSFTDPATTFYLKICEVEAARGWAKATGTVRVQVDEPVLDLKDGDYIRAYCWLDRFKGPTNPGQFNTAGYLARKNIYIAASIKSREGIELLKGSPVGAFTRARRKVRTAAARALLGDLAIEDSSRGLLEALLLGYRRNIDSDTYRAFRETGLLHFISLSGMHLGILVALIWWLCKAAGLLKRARAAVCIFAVALFLLIVPPRAPTVRAAIICWVFCVSVFFRRRPNPLNTLSLAAVILLLLRPTQLFEAGWQLSFASVLGILLFSDPVHSCLKDRMARLPSDKESPAARRLLGITAKPASYLLGLLSVGFAAWLGGAGILLYHFYTINPLTCVWTVLIFPLVAGILSIGFLKIVISFVLPTAAAVLGVLVTGLADLMIWIVKLLARLDISQLLIGHVPLTLIVLYYCFIIFTTFANLRRPLIKRVVCAALVLPVVILLITTKWQRTHRDNLVMTALDVGHGQAILARLPGTTNILFDAGSLHKSNVGRRIVIPFLNYAGIDKIHAIIISHNDIDHTNGIPEIAEHCDVAAVYAGDEFFSKADRWGTAKFLRERLLARRLEVRRLGKNFETDGGANVKILWPSDRAAHDGKLTDNDKSLVCMIEFAERKILLCSDIERLAQRELVPLLPNPKVDVTVVPHHGSAKTTEADFLTGIGSDILICSCGRRAFEKQQIIRPMEGPAFLCTPAHGAVGVRINEDGRIETATFTKR
ncbi:MAG: DNA internalization-related competence protein ComEC/Rec2 [Planctomycetota bacterium]|jgi:competence protein ComEC